MTGKWETLVSIPGLWGMGAGATVVWPELELHVEDVQVKLCGQLRKSLCDQADNQTTPSSKNRT